MRCSNEMHAFRRISSGSSGRVRGGGPRNMKSMRPPSVAIFFMTFFHRARGGGHGPLAPPLDPLLRIWKAEHFLENNYYLLSEVIGRMKWDTRYFVDITATFLRSCFCFCFQRSWKSWALLQGLSLFKSFKLTGRRHQQQNCSSPFGFDLWKQWRQWGFLQKVKREMLSTLD